MTLSEPTAPTNREPTQCEWSVLTRKLGHESPSATIGRYGDLVTTAGDRRAPADPQTAVRHLAEKVLRDLDTDG